MNVEKVDLVVVGGGAAGFFTAINYASKHPHHRVVILEKSKKVLSKVKVSGGGRCNLTHACFEPRELLKFYPRGGRGKELLGPFHKFNPKDTMQWFESRGVPLKVEADNRVFPVSDKSQTIIDCLLDQVDELHVELLTQQKVNFINKHKEIWHVYTEEEQFNCNRLVLASGGNSKTILENISDLGIHLIENVPSWFTFNVKDKRLQELAGVVAPNVRVKINKTKFNQSGPLLVTHWGLSGPAILKLSSVSARELYKLKYKFSIQVDWCSGYTENGIVEKFSEMKKQQPKRSIGNTSLFGLPKRLWVSLLLYAKIEDRMTWADINKKSLNRLQEILKNSSLEVDGKSTNKEEFVTSGGVDLKEINFNDFSTKKHPTLHIVGELLNIDAVTGGFNFQAAWTTGYLAANSI